MEYEHGQGTQMEEVRGAHLERKCAEPEVCAREFLGGARNPTPSFKLEADQNAEVPPL